MAASISPLTFGTKKALSGHWNPIFESNPKPLLDLGSCL